MARFSEKRTLKRTVVRERFSPCKHFCSSFNAAWALAHSLKQIIQGPACWRTGRWLALFGCLAH